MTQDSTNLDWGTFCLQCFNCDPLEDCEQWTPFQIAVKQRDKHKYLIAVRLAHKVWGEKKGEEEIQFFWNEFTTADDTEWLIMTFVGLKGLYTYRLEQQSGLVKALTFCGYKQGKDFIVDDGITFSKQFVKDNPEYIEWTKKFFRNVKIVIEN